MLCTGRLPQLVGALTIAICVVAAACRISSPDITALTDASARPTDSYGWVACSSSFVPLSDAEAASQVVPAKENRPDNASANQYRPSSSELSAFLTSERDSSGLLPEEYNPYFRHVTGGFSGTTDEIIQWAAAKWGIPADWLRAQYVEQSSWRQSEMGNLTTVQDPLKYPDFSRASGDQVYQSLGITMLKWNHPDANTVNPGTEPLRWRSTAFNIDYQVAKVRFFFDDPDNKRSSWGDSTYSPCDNWLSIGGWYQPHPWDNSDQQEYVARVKDHLAKRAWEQSGF